MVSAVVACLGFTVFFIEFATTFVGRFKVPCKVGCPELTQNLGELTFLTTWSNFMGVMYFSFCILASMGNASAQALVVPFAPMIFALGVFLTLAYYGLVHFNPAEAEFRARFEDQYPRVHIGGHVLHFAALGIVMLHATFLTDGVPTLEDVCTFAGIVPTVYCMAVHVNWLLTGEWVYAFIEASYNAGVLVHCIVCTSLTCVFIALGLLGRAIIDAAVMAKESCAAGQVVSCNGGSVRIFALGSTAFFYSLLGVAIYYRRVSRPHSE